MRDIYILFHTQAHTIYVLYHFYRVNRAEIQLMAIYGIRACVCGIRHTLPGNVFNQFNRVI